MNQSVLTAKEAAVILRISVSTMYQLLKEGRVPCIQIGQRRVIPRERFMEWIQAATVGGKL